MYIGAHVSVPIGRGFGNAPQNAHKAGCEVFQFFSRSPRGGQAPELTSNIIKEFKHAVKKYKQKECYIHAPYYINLASKKNNIYHGSIAVLREELERGTQLGIKYMMTHLGSAKDLGKKEAIKKVIKGITEILDGYSGSCQLLLEMSAGAGNIIGDTFQEIAEIIKEIKGNKRNKIGVCYDTAHAFESGYDMRTPDALKKTFDEFDKIIGLDKLKLIHVNDSKTKLGSCVDRHEHIGYGEIGIKGFKALLKEKRLKNINLVLETPDDKIREDDIRVLKDVRDGIK